MQALAQMRLYALGTSLFSNALWIALPMMALLLFVNLAMGIISRVAPPDEHLCCRFSGDVDCRLMALRQQWRAIPGGTGRVDSAATAGDGACLPLSGKGCRTYGYHVDYYPINDVMTYYNAVSDEDVKALVAEY